jgi:calcium-dependent protein kinase
VTNENQLGELSSSVLKHLAAFRANTRLQQATFSYIASSMTSNNEIDELRKAFIILDTDGDGHLSELELKRGFSNISLSASVKLEDILKSCDSDMNGQIDYSEFITAAIDWQKHLSKEILENTFKAYDRDNSGSISITEIREFLGSDSDEMELLIYKSSKT